MEIGCPHFEWGDSEEIEVVLGSRSKYSRYFGQLYWMIVIKPTNVTGWGERPVHRASHEMTRLGLLMAPCPHWETSRSEDSAFCGSWALGWGTKKTCVVERSRPEPHTQQWGASLGRRRPLCTGLTSLIASHPHPTCALLTLPRSM